MFAISNSYHLTQPPSVPSYPFIYPAMLVVVAALEGPRRLVWQQFPLLNLLRQSRNSITVFIPAIDSGSGNEIWTTAAATAAKVVWRRCHLLARGPGVQPSTLTFRVPPLHRAQHATKPITAAEQPLQTGKDQSGHTVSEPI